MFNQNEVFKQTEEVQIVSNETQITKDKPEMLVAIKKFKLNSFNVSFQNV